MTDSVNKPVFAGPGAARDSKKEGASVTVTLTKQEEAMLQELCRVRRRDEQPIPRMSFSNCC